MVCETCRRRIVDVGPAYDAPTDSFYCPEHHPDRKSENEEKEKKDAPVRH